MKPYFLDYLTSWNYGVRSTKFSRADACHTYWSRWSCKMQYIEGHVNHLPLSLIILDLLMLILEMSLYSVHFFSFVLFS